MRRGVARWLTLALLMVVGPLACRSVDGEGAPTYPEVLEIRGTLKRIPLEGGFWGIVADDGARYRPGDLPAELMRDGLRVEGRVQPLHGMVGIQMWGIPVKVIELRPLR
ncbi:MAG TPA: hypothetical protein ENK54_10495 [Thiotrichales bacterium]|nr:hypothetical protein [Thiotrichales bacterium]